MHRGRLEQPEPLERAVAGERREVLLEERQRLPIVATHVARLAEAGPDEDQQVQVTQRCRHGQRPVAFGHRRGGVACHPELVQEERGRPDAASAVAQALRQRLGLAEVPQDGREVAERQQGVAKLEAQLERLLEGRPALW
jgi:hypothetical protein